MTLGLDINVAAKHGGPILPTLRAEFLSRALQSLLAARSVLHDLWVVYQTLCLHPTQGHSLAPLLDGINEEVCNAFLYTHTKRKTKQNSTPAFLKPIYSNPDI